MMSHPFRKLSLLCVLSAAACGAALAQTTTQGALTGTIFDATDAVIPNATITIRNTGTNAALVLTSDASGSYRAPQLTPGVYTVTVKAAGFAELRSSNVVIEVNIATELNEHLTTGSENTTVEVVATTPVLNFESAAYGGHLSNVEIENIPINNRRWSELALLQPGTTIDTAGFGLIQFRAISDLLNVVEIDGADDNQAFFAEERGRTRAGYSTSQAAVREFTVNSGVYSAEFGRAVGGVINSVTKSGSNTLHGEVYFYNRDSSRGAFAYNTFITVPTGPNTYSTVPYKPTDKRNQFGFAAGGALIKDKLFWNYAFDEYRRNFPGTAKINTPSAVLLPIDAALPAGTSCGTVTAATGVVTGLTTTLSAGDQAVCLLSQRLNTTYAAAAIAYNAQLAAVVSDTGKVARFGDQGINTPKLDWQVNGKNHVSLLYHRLRWDSPGGVQTQATNNYGVDGFGTDFVKLDYGVGILASVFGRFTNELRYQYGRELNDEGRQTPSAYTTSNLLNPANTIPVAANVLSTGNGLTLGTPYYSFRTAYPAERKWQIGDTASVQIGHHSIKFGEDVVHNYDLQNTLGSSAAYPNGNFVYNNTFGNYFADLISKKGTCNSAGTGVGTAAAGFYPCYSTFTQAVGPSTFDLATTDYAVFVQDDWKVSPRLTLNLGARYDYESFPAPFSNLVTIPQTATRPSDKNNIAPRLGFAWDPYGSGKTAVHGGFGMYYGRIPNNMLLSAFISSGSANAQQAYSFTPSTTGAPLLPTTATVAPPASAVGPSIQYLDSHLQNPYTLQFDMAVQQDLGHGYILSASYIGALGRELPNFLNVNLNPDSAHSYTFNYVVAPATGTQNCGPLACGTVIPTKVYANKLQTGPTASTYVYNTPYTQFNTVVPVLSNINSSYHAMTTEIQHRDSKYVAFDVSYTWSHALDFNQNSFTSGGTNGWFDPFGNARANYGNSAYNIPQRVTGWFLINLPGVKNHGYAIREATSGWSIKPLVQAQTGNVYSLNVSGTAASQCVAVGCLEAAGADLSGTGVAYIPQVGRNTYRQPPTVLQDLRIQKDFMIREKYNLQIFGEAFNLPNHLNVTAFNTSGYTITTTNGATPATTTSNLVYNTGFGTISSANSNFAYGPRNIQIAARLVF